MANVADTKLYDILGVPPGASENELKKVVGSGTAGQGVRGAGLRGRDGQAALRGCPRAGAGPSGPKLGGGGGETGLGWPWAVGPARPQMQQIKPTPAQTAEERFLPLFPGGRRRPGAPGRQHPARPSPHGGHHPGKTGWTEAHSASRPRERSCPRRGSRRRVRIGARFRVWLEGWGRPRRCLRAVEDVSWVPRPLEHLPLFLLRSPTCGSLGVLFCGQVT